MKILRSLLLAGSAALLTGHVWAEPQAPDPLLVKDEPRKLEGHAKDKVVAAVAISPDGRLLASAAQDGYVIVWELGTGKALRKLEGVGDQAYAVAFSPDGSLLAAAGMGTDIKLWKVGSWQELATLKGHKESVPCLAFSPDGTLLASGGYDGTVRLWVMPSGELKHRLTGHEGRITGLAFSPDGKVLASGGTGVTEVAGISICQSDRVRLWDVPGGKLLRTLEARADRVAYSPDGRTLGLAQGDHVEVYRVPKGGKPKGQIRINDIQIDAYAVVRLLDAPSGREFFTAPSRGREIVFSPDGRTFALGQGIGFHQQGTTINGGPYANDYRLSVWETATQTELFRFGDEYANCFAFAPDRQFVIWGTRQARC